MDNNLSISIVTPVLNSFNFLEKTILSVKNQDYPYIEHIIIDGESTDGTLDIIKKYDGKYNMKWLSEKDNGIYSAMNKGFALTKGDVVGILNSDDTYASEKTISTIVKSIKNSDCCWGNLIYVDKKDKNKTIRRWDSSSYKKNLFKKGWHPPHPTFFVKREIFLKYGLFNINFKIASDYELMLRFLEKHNISSVFIPEILVKMTIGGISNKNIFNVFKANIECYKSWKINNLKINPLMILLKPLSKINQYFNY